MDLRHLLPRKTLYLYYMYYVFMYITSLSMTAVSDPFDSDDVKYKLKWVFTHVEGNHL